MIDVMMFLLVFFVLISINVLPALGLNIKPPSSAKPDQIVEHNRITVGLDADGNAYVDGKLIAIPDIHQKLAEAHDKDPAKTLVVVVSADAKAEMQQLIDVLDELKIADVHSAQIVAKQKDGAVAATSVSTTTTAPAAPAGSAPQSLPPAANAQPAPPAAASAPPAAAATPGKPASGPGATASPAIASGSPAAAPAAGPASSVPAAGVPAAGQPASTAANASPPAAASAPVKPPLQPAAPAPSTAGVPGTAGTVPGSN